jgi:hypothetical protein
VPLSVTLGHLLVQDTAAGRHPLHVSGGHFALVPQAVAVFDGAGKHVGDRLNTAVGMPWESRPVVVRVVIAKIIQQQEWIEIFRLAESEGALQLDAGAFNSGLRLNDLFNRAE